MKNNPVVLGVISLVIGAAVGFYGGTIYQKNQTPANFKALGGEQGMMRNGTGQGANIVRNGGTARGGFKPVSGEVISVDDKSMTVKMSDGSSRIVIFSDKTEINKAEAVEKSELKEGSTVAVFGTENPDGSMTAQNIQLDPKSMMIKTDK